VTLGTVIFLAVGIAVITIAEEAIRDIDYLCDNESTESGLAEALDEIYTIPSVFYCEAPSDGCTCYVTHVPSDNVSKSYSLVQTSSTVTNVQGCSAYIMESFKDYDVEFSDIQDAIEYLDYFGEIEKEYKCSGICTAQSTYFYYDSSKGQPPAS